LDAFKKKLIFFVTLNQFIYRNISSVELNFTKVKQIYAVSYASKLSFTIKYY